MEVKSLKTADFVKRDNPHTQNISLVILPCRLVRYFIPRNGNYSLILLQFTHKKSGEFV